MSRAAASTNASRRSAWATGSSVPGNTPPLITRLWVYFKGHRQRPSTLRVGLWVSRSDLGGDSGGHGRGVLESAVDVRDCVRPERRLTGSRQHDAHQIQRVGGRDGDGLAGALLFPNRPERVHSLGEGVLLAAESADKPPSPNGSSGFHASEPPQDVAPGHAERLTSHQAPEQHAPP